jgi:hypothetical protein
MNGGIYNKEYNAILYCDYCKLCRGFYLYVRVYLRSVETIRNVLILKVIVKVNKEIVLA